MACKVKQSVSGMRKSASSTKARLVKEGMLVCHLGASIKSVFSSLEQLLESTQCESLWIVFMADYRAD